MRAVETIGVLVSTAGMMASDLMGDLSLPGLGAIGPWVNYGAMGMLAYVLLLVVREQRKDGREMRDLYEARLLDAQRLRDRHLDQFVEDHAACRDAHLQMLALIDREKGDSHQ